MTEAVNLIGTVGFPIAMCLIVSWYVYKKDVSHKEEIDKLSEAVNAQTLSIQKLVDRIDKLIGGYNNAE